MVGGVAIIGCGNIGAKRALHTAGAPVLACADVVLDRAQDLAARHPRARAYQDWRTCLDHPGVNVVVVSTINRDLAKIAGEAARRGKHVLVEKPAGRRAAELYPILELIRQTNVVVKAGFNHRFHPALAQARALVDAGAVGPLMFVRGRYGHGGRLGYDKEWRADPEMSGGGELLDQGVHLIDLARWFLGEFSVVEGHVTRSFWDMPVEDNGFVSLRTPTGQTAWLHVSCSEWKNLFCLEIYGQTGKLQIDGLGGSYGVERLTLYKMLPEMGPPETTTWEFPGADISWGAEFSNLVNAIEGRSVPNGDLADAISALEIVELIYLGRQAMPNQRMAG